MNNDNKHKNAHAALVHKMSEHKNYLTMPHSNKRANYDIVNHIVHERLISKAREQKVAEAAIPAFLKTHLPRITESSMRFEIPIDATSTLYQFPVLENEQVNGLAPFPEEIRLNINDLFFMTQIGIYARIELETLIDGVYDYKSSFLLPYSPFELSLAFYDALENLWGGHLEILVNNINMLDNYDLMKHKTVPRTQFATYKSPITPLPLGYNPVSEGYSAATLASLDYKNDGWNELQPMIELSGSKKDTIQIILPQTLQVPALPNYIAYTNPAFAAEPISNVITMRISNLVFMTRGLLVQNFSSFQN